ncbi:MAG: metallophosphoesterase family protein [bacterium]
MENWLNENTFIISDTHFDHSNIISFEPMRAALIKPEEVSEYFDLTRLIDIRLIEIWNSIIKPEDHVLHLGDVVMGGKDRITGYVKKLNGRIHLLKGNHDSSNYIYEELGVDVLEDVHIFLDGTYDLLAMKHKYANAVITEINGYRIMFSHFPVINNIVHDIGKFNDTTVELYEIFKKYYCDVNIHGHVHSHSIKIASFCVNASIEVMDFEPWKVKDILKQLQLLKIGYDKV